jgi:hypothetical protein
LPLSSDASGVFPANRYGLSDLALLWAVPDRGSGCHCQSPECPPDSNRHFSPLCIFSSFQVTKKYFHQGDFSQSLFLVSFPALSPLKSARNVEDVLTFAPEAKLRRHGTSSRLAAVFCSKGSQVSATALVSSPQFFPLVVQDQIQSCILGLFTGAQLEGAAVWCMPGADGNSTVPLFGHRWPIVLACQLMGLVHQLHISQTCCIQ